MKLYNLLGICLLLMTLAIIAYSYVSARRMVDSAVDAATRTAANIAEETRKNALEGAMEQLVAEAGAKAFQIEARLEEAMGVAATLAEVFSGLASAGVAVDVGRDSVNSILHTNLHYHRNLTAAYSIWEEDSFDMLDLAYVGADGHDRTGRFIPYWYRDERGDIFLQPCADYENGEEYAGGVRKGEYYLAPRETLSARIIDPYPRSLGRERSFVTSVVVPVLVEEVFLGIAGVDLKLDLLQELTERIGGSFFMGRGRVMIISHNGTVAGISNRSDGIGKHLGEFYPDWERYMETVGSGLTATMVEKGRIMVFTPLTVGHTETLWSVHVSVPEQLVHDRANALYDRMMKDVADLDRRLSRGSSEAVVKQMGVGAMLLLVSMWVLHLTRKLDKSRTALLESEGRLQSILDHSPAVVYLKNLENRYLLVNRKFEKLFNFAKGEVRGKTDGDIFPESTARAFRENDQKVLAAGRAMQLEETAPLEDGMHTYISVKFPVLGTSGEAYGICGISTDITHRKKTEEEIKKLRNFLGNILNSMPSEIVGVNRDARITQWNLRAETTTGIKAAEALGRPLLKVFPRMEKEMAKIRRAIDKREVQKGEKVSWKEHGKTRYSDVTVYPLVADGVEGAVIRVDDITPRVFMEEMMIQSEKMLSVGGLAAGMAHEINNPLAGILQNLQVVENRIWGDLPANTRAAEALGISLDDVRAYLDDREIPDKVTSITASGRRIAVIVDNMLSFSRKGDASFADHDLRELLDKILELAGSDYDLKTRYDFKSIEIKREYDPDLPKVPCEGSKIQQVFLNLLRNGAQAMAGLGNPKRAPRFVLRLRVESPMVRIEIEDNGPGMAESVRKRVFEPFYTTKEVGEGTGLGLSVSYFIVTENHDGEMSVESAPGKGTRFVIRLPLRQDHG